MRDFMQGGLLELPPPPGKIGLIQLNLDNESDWFAFEYFDPP
jgi:hypothetical protein